MNLEELLEFSKIKIATNGKNLLYIISIPLISNETCTHTILKPIKKGKIIYEIKYTKIIQCNQINYGLKGNCETHNDKSICNKINLVDLSNDTCITPLLRSRTPNCKIINSQHEEILNGTILLNDKDDDVRQGCTPSSSTPSTREQGRRSSFATNAKGIQYQQYQGA